MADPKQKLNDMLNRQQQIRDAQKAAAAELEKKRLEQEQNKPPKTGG